MSNSTLIPIATAGLGLMGSSIAACLLAAGHPVTSLVRKQEEAAAARERIHAHLVEMRREGLLSVDPDLLMDRIVITDDPAQLAGHSVVIESISENAAEKKRLFEVLENILPADAVIGSNTSAIPVSLLQQGLKHPERVLGIHWAEPAHVTRFMEVICGRQSDIQYAERIVALAGHWGKEPSLLKKDIRGFITNRIMYAMLREAFFLVENGYATVEDVDRSLRNDLGYWITFAGPFRFMDITGIPAYLTVMKELFGELDNSTDPPATIQRLVEEGALGTANAHGFYSYTPDTARNWEKAFMEFSYAIRKLAVQYPHNIGDTR